MEKAKIVELKDGQKVKIKIIESIDKYRGFYYMLKDGTFIEANYNSNAIKELADSGYKRGYDLTHGQNIVEHLYNKLMDKKSLNEYEEEDIYDHIDICKPIVKIMGVNYDFRNVLFKHKGIMFWTINEKPNKSELDIFYDSEILVDKNYFS